MKKILVIEDNSEMLENISEILELADYEVYQAANGKLGVQKAKEIIPDLIISDIMMPELEGYSVLKILSQEERTKNIPFIFLTAKSDKADFRKGMLLGADDYLTKPFEENDLLEAVEIRLKKHQNLTNGKYNSPKSIDELLQTARIFTFRKKEFIYKESSQSEYLYFVRKGKVKVYQTNEFGKDFITNVYNKDDFFGYTTILNNENHADNAVALEETDVFFIDKNKFIEFVLWSKSNAGEFLSLLSKNIQEKEEKLVALAYNSVRKRVATTLKELNTKFNAGENNKDIIMSREDLANIAGTATETLIRTLSDFQDEGLIEIAASRITILQLDKIATMRN